MLGAKHASYLQLWRGRVMECRNSGKTISFWCKENGINIKSYYFWQKRVGDKETQTLIQSGQNQLPQAQAVQFAQVNLGMESSSGADIVIRNVRLGISRNTVKKYWEGDAVPWEKKTYEREPSVITPEVRNFIVTCLDEDDSEGVTKQKHTARRIYDRLENEHGSN